MKKIILIVFLIPFLLCFKCVEKERKISITVVNQRNQDYLFYRKSDGTSINHMIENEKDYGPTYVIAEKGKTAQDSLREFNIDFYSKDMKLYTFYFYKMERLKLSNNFGYKISETYDSINLNREELKFGKQGNNVFILAKDKVYFKN